MALKYPVDPDYIIKSKSEARKYVRLAKQHFRSLARDLVSDIEKLDSSLTMPVAWVCDVLSQNLGQMTARNIKTDRKGYGHGMEVHNIDIDEEVTDALADRFGDDAIEEAGQWLLKRLHGHPAAFVSWALGPVIFEGVEGRSPTVLENRILFDLENRKWVAVCSHHQWDHPEGTVYEL